MNRITSWSLIKILVHGRLEQIMYYTYVLWSNEDRKFYIGYSTNLERRLNDHRKGQVHTTCRMTKPELIFYEAFISEEDAIRRESYFKTSKGKKTLRLMLRDSLNV